MAFVIENGVLMKYDGGETNIVIPEGVTRIEEGAFYRIFDKTCVLTFPSTLQSIAEDAFQHCTFQTIHISSLADWLSVKVEGDYNSVLCNASKVLFGGEKLEALTIPEGVADIGNCQFYGCESIVKLVLPDSVTRIGNQAFEGCKNLTEIKLPEKLKSIGTSAFSGCGIRSVQIPDAVKAIGSEAFFGCQNLTYIALPSQLTSIQNGMLQNCSALTDIKLPQTITQIGSYAFLGSGLSLIELPEHIKTIRECAFEDCTSLKNVTIPPSLQKIEEDAFSGCDQIEAVYVKDLKSWLQVDNDFSLLRIKSLYVDGKRLERLEIPADIDTIGKYAFFGCADLTEVVIPAHVRRIEEGAFRECEALKRVVITGATEIGDYAFMDCDTLEEIQLSNDIQKIGESAFARCKKLKTITLPTKLDKISEGLFEGCAALTSLVTPENIQRIGNRAFFGCSALPEIVIPKTVKSIGAETFRECAALKHVDLPTSVTAINDHLFDASGLEEITLPKGVKTINSFAFCNCAELKEITVPTTVTKISDSAFRNTQKLERIVLQCTLKAITKNTFSESEQQRNVYIREDELANAKKLIKNARFFNLEGEEITKVKRAASAKAVVSTDPGEWKVVYPAGIQLPGAKFNPIIVGKGFVKPTVKELYVNAGGAQFTVTFKIGAKLSAIWKQFYNYRGAECIFDPQTVLAKAGEFSSGYVDEKTGVYVSNPLHDHFPDDVRSLTAKQVEKRLSDFVTLLHRCALEENLKLIFEKAEKKKNGLLYKGRILHLAYLDLVDYDGVTYELVAKNNDETQLYIELRSNVPVVNDLIRQSYLLIKAK